MYIYIYMYTYIYVCIYGIYICICSPFCLKHSWQLLLLILFECKNSKVLYCQIMALVEWTAEEVADVQAKIKQVYNWERAFAQKLQLANDQGWTNEQIKYMVRREGNMLYGNGQQKMVQ